MDAINKLLEDYQELQQQHKEMKNDIKVLNDDLKGVSLMVQLLTESHEYADKDAINSVYINISNLINNINKKIEDQLK